MPPVPSRPAAASRRAGIAALRRIVALGPHTATRRALLILAAFVAVSLPVAVGPSTVRAFSAPQASDAYSAFVGTYWNAATKTFYSMSNHTARPGGSVGADFWWTAEMWEVVMDRFERTGDPAARTLIDQVFDGFTARYPTFNSDFNDDRGWWALGATRAYQLTGETRFLTTAEAISNDVWRYSDGTYGGGIWWRRSVHDQKNVATNAPAAIVAVRLFVATGDPAYRDRAVRVFGWVDSELRDASQLYDHVDSGGRVNWEFAYDYGTYLEAAAALGSLLGDASYTKSALWEADRATTVLAPGGILKSEGTGDGGAFKGVFVRNLSDLIRVFGQTQHAGFLARNADEAWLHRTASGLNGPDWTAPTTGPIDAATESSAAALFELSPVAGAPVQTAAPTAVPRPTAGATTTRPFAAPPSIPAGTAASTSVPAGSLAANAPPVYPSGGAPTVSQRPSDDSPDTSAPGSIASSPEGTPRPLAPTGSTTGGGNGPSDSTFIALVLAVGFILLGPVFQFRAWVRSRGRT